MLFALEMRGAFAHVLAHWILQRSQGKQACQMQFAGNFSLALGQLSCKLFLKSQVGIISLGVFQVFCEARATRAHDPMDSRLLRSIASTAARRLTCLSQ